MPGGTLGTLTMSYTAGRMPMILLLAGLGKEVLPHGPPFGGLSQREQSLQE